MCLPRSLFGLALVLVIPAVALSGSANGGKKGGKKDASHAVRGVVTEIKRDGDADNGAITIRVHKKKAAAADKDNLKTFQILSTTKFEKVTAGKKEPAEFKDLHEGDRVAVVPLDDRPNIARLVKIGKKKDQ